MKRLLDEYSNQGALQMENKINDEIKYQETLNEAIKTFGADKQINMAIEEMSELIKELCKYKRAFANLPHIQEEIADVQITLDQMKLLFDQNEEIEEFKKLKVQRLEKLIRDSGKKPVVKRYGLTEDLVVVELERMNLREIEGQLYINNIRIIAQSNNRDWLIKIRTEMRNGK